MLNPFPIQFLAPLAYTVLRLCVGVIFLRLGARHLKNKNQKTINMAVPSGSTSLFVLMGIIELVAGSLFILGAYTQIGAGIALVLTAVQVLRPHLWSYHGYPPRIFFILLFATSFSLFITGAGAFAFDLPI